MPQLHSPLNALIFSVSLLVAMASHGDEGLPPPKSHPLCQQEPVQKEIERERVFHHWPDGTVKSKMVYYLDGTYVQRNYHANGQLELESHHTKVLIDGNPRKRRHVKHGTEKRWFDNGQLFVCRVYEEGKKVGTWISYDDEGTPRTARIHENDREVEHLTFSRVFGWQPFKK